MSKKLLCAAILGLLVFSADLSAANRLSIGAQTLAVGQTGAKLPVTLDSDEDLYGFSLSIQTDLASLKLISVSLTGTAAATADWSFGKQLSNGAGISWGVVMSLDPFVATKVIPAGTSIHAADLVVDVMAQAEGFAAVDFTDIGGNPVSKNLLVGEEGTPVTPLSFVPGAVTISTGGPLFRRGDSDSNTRLELTDAVKILGFLFLGQTEPPCLESADADDNGRIELTDAVRILGFLFLGGTPIPAPGPPPADCGNDPPGSPATLSCNSYSC